MKKFKEFLNEYVNDSISEIDTMLHYIESRINSEDNLSDINVFDNGDEYTIKMDNRSIIYIKSKDKVSYEVDGDYDEWENSVYVGFGDVFMKIYNKLNRRYV